MGNHFFCAQRAEKTRFYPLFPSENDFPPWEKPPSPSEKVGFLQGKHLLD